ncbi:hypothetical protein GLAREA_12682 [Glarea lozoyensis ATCC 20868]|uniref:Uncharacterized protein n=1 Tax=Glarea lozoyensis (strain ATCC 20868 / MF5171) TaxID=1116229 RepID=S3D2K5_GLAL2|nr:uncharacterized protein GLAREA_12682 [Glarea lozoyensis ATCC 20868]EPE31379.1 hypothetical protein GLAREA_12682 [Glarea lozoyensis ATCC 20868]
MVCSARALFVGLYEKRELRKWKGAALGDLVGRAACDVNDLGDCVIVESAVRGA